MSGFLSLSLCTDLESETGDDNKVGSDDEVASVHEDEQSKNTNDKSTEGCLERKNVNPMSRKARFPKKKERPSLRNLLQY